MFIVGFGNVGREAALLVHSTSCLELAGAASSKGAVIAGKGADAADLALLASRGERLEKHREFREGIGAVEAALEAAADYAIIAIPPSYKTGEPNKSIVLGLLSYGIGVGLADKTVPALYYDELVETAESRRAPLGLRATVMAGTPATDVAKALAPRGIEAIRGVLNATTNYIITMVEEGLTFKEAISRAVEYKLAEPDPTVDTHGLDAAAKLVILAKLAGHRASLRDVERVPLESVPEDEVRAAKRRGARVRYVATADLSSSKMKVAPEIVEATSHLGIVEKEYNAVEFILEGGSTVTLAGPTGPAWRTARVLVAEAFEAAGCTEERLPRARP